MMFSMFAAVLMASGVKAKPDQFNVNFYGTFGNPPAGWEEIVMLTPEQTAGVAPWNSTGWSNIRAGKSTTKITSTGNKTATFKLAQVRNGGSFSSRKFRPAATHNDGNASLLDGHMNTTENPGDGTMTGILEVSEIPFAAYDVVLYLGIQRAQYGEGKGWVKINDAIEKRFMLDKAVPNWKFTRIKNPSKPGNYLVIPGLSGANLKIEMAGENFTHLGAAGMQIIEAAEARKKVEITKVSPDKSKKELSVTWHSVPGDFYSMSYSIDEKKYYPLGNPAISANATGYTTTLTGIPHPVPNTENIFIRLGAADYHDPKWEGLSGVGNVIALGFSEPLFGEVATNTANYAVTDEKGQKVAISKARVGRTNNYVELVLASPMAGNKSVTVSVRNLVDVTGRRLADTPAKSFKTWDNKSKGVKVIIIAGQSNMVGYGESESGNGKVAGALGSLRHLVNTQPAKYGGLVDKDGKWIARNDVKFWWNRGNNIIKGDLNVGQGSSKSRIGPEYAVGQIMGDHFEEPVLIIKTAWGGKSLSIDFRPPSAVRKRGGKVGFYYKEMLNNIHQVLDNFSAEYPEHAAQGYDIVGFGWHQGYNDGLSNFPATEYKENLPDFIADIRAEFGKPLLPFALASTGHGGASQKGSWLTLTNSQLAIGDAAQFPQLKGNVSATDTRLFWRDTKVSPTNQGHHWNHNAETYYEIGEVIANGLKTLMSKK
tara:strand:+ start:3802 stop:5931 length:2130 start_codon:yes stop_codon:yes gene_type:complete